MNRSKSITSGFTLLEVIVALAIMSICVTALLRIFTGASVSTALGEEYYKALQIAETQLALIAEEDNPIGIRRGSVDDYYRWQSKVDEYRPGMNNPLFPSTSLIDLESSVVPLEYRVTVSWGGSDKRHVELTTIRLGAPN